MEYYSTHFKRNWFSASFWLQNTKKMKNTNKVVEEMIYWKIMRLTSQQIAHALILSFFVSHRRQNIRDICMIYKWFWIWFSDVECCVL